MTYTKEELLDGLREFAAENGGEPPTQTEADEADTMPSGVTYHNRFGSWNAAIEAAGFTPRASPSTEYTKEELLDALREYAAEHDGETPTLSEVKEADSMPSGATYLRRFESWNKALEAAGFTPRPSGFANSDEELLDALREYAAEHDGETPTLSEVGKADTLPSRTTYRRRFESWNAALEAAGFTPNAKSPEYSDEELLDALREFAAEHGGEPPTASEVKEADTMPSGMTYQRRFGSWNAAIEAAGLTADSPEDGETSR